MTGVFSSFETGLKELHRRSYFQFSIFATEESRWRVGIKRNGGAIRLGEEDWGGGKGGGGPQRSIPDLRARGDAVRRSNLATRVADYRQSRVNGRPRCSAVAVAVRPFRAG